MRITGGVAKGRPIKAPPGQRTRPTLARVREAIFDILGAAVGEASFLDLFAGSGSVGLEALSRGAARVLFVEIRPENCALIRANLRSLGLGEGASIWCLDALKAVRRLAAKGEKFDIIFADPPYGAKWLEAIGAGVARAGILAPRGSFLVQAGGKEEAPPALGGLSLQREYRYGDTKLFLYRWSPGGGEINLASSGEGNTGGSSNC